MQYSRLISFVALCALPFALPVFATAAPSESDASDFERRDCTATSNAGFIRVAWTQAGQSHSFYLGDTSATLTTGATNQCFLAGHLDGTTLEGEVAAVYTFSACDKHADGTPFAITCSTCASQPYLGGTAYTDPHGSADPNRFGDPAQIVIRKTSSASPLIQQTSVTGYTSQFYTNTKAAIWQWDNTAQALNVYWKAYSSTTYSPYIIRLGDSGQEGLLTYASAQPDNSYPATVTWVPEVVVGPGSECQTPNVCSSGHTCTNSFGSRYCV